MIPPLVIRPKESLLQTQKMALSVNLVKQPIKPTVALKAIGQEVNTAELYVKCAKVLSPLLL